jgi:hypothetical protein
VPAPREPAEHAVARVPERGADAAGKDHQDEKETRARRQEGPFGLHEEVLDALDEDGADDRAADGAEPAHDDHREHAESGDGVEVVGVERVLLQDEQRAGDAGEEARNGVRHHERAARPHGIGLRRAFVVAHADQHATDAAGAQPPDHPEAQCEHDDDEHVVRALAGDGDHAEDVGAGHGLVRHPALERRVPDVQQIAGREQ